MALVLTRQTLPVLDLGRCPCGRSAGRGSRHLLIALTKSDGTSRSSRGMNNDSRHDQHLLTNWNEGE